MQSEKPWSQQSVLRLNAKTQSLKKVIVLKLKNKSCFILVSVHLVQSLHLYFAAVAVISLPRKEDRRVPSAYRRTRERIQTLPEKTTLPRPHLQTQALGTSSIHQEEAGAKPLKHLSVYAFKLLVLRNLFQHSFKNLSFYWSDNYLIC